MSDDKGRLLGGPWDGKDFSMNGNWRVVGNETMEPAPTLLVTRAGSIVPLWPDSRRSPAPAPRPEMYLYTIDPDDPGWLYRYAGEDTAGTATATESADPDG